MNFLDEFAEELKKSDKTYILDIHPAREKQEDFPNINSNILIDLIPNAEQFNIDDTKNLTKHNNQVFLFLGANDLKDIEERLIDYLK